MKTIQKRVKFSKGEINSLLDERTDLGILEESASYIKNYIPTIFGGIKTRKGTKLVSSLLKTYIENPTVDNRIGGISDLLFNKNQNYKSDLYEAGNSLDILCFKLNFKEHIDSITLHGVKKKTRTEATLNWEFEKENDYYKIKNITITDGGYGYIEAYDTSIIVEGICEEIPVIKPVIEKNQLSSIIIENAGKITQENIENIVLKLPFSKNVEQTSIIYAKAYFDDGITGNGGSDNFEINETPQTITLRMNNRPTKIVDIRDNNSKFNDDPNREGYLDYKGLEIQYITFHNINDDIISYDGNVSIIPFVFNKDEKFLIVLKEKTIEIYYNDVKIQDLQCEFLKKEYIQHIKYTQYENIMVLTYKEMYPLKLERKNNVWSINKLNLQNIPVYAFNGEIENNGTIKLTPSTEEGSGYLIAESNYFNNSFVGQIIDGGGGRFRITKYENAKKVFGYTIIPFYTKDSFTNYKYINGFEKVWSDKRGYPSTCLFYQERLWFGGSKSRPLTIWGSRLNQFEDFNNVGSYDADSINIDISTKENNEIVSLYGNRGLQIFTGGAEFIISENSLTPNTISVVQTSSTGSDNQINPVDIAGNTIFVGRNKNNLYSFLYDYNQANYTSSILTLINNTILNKPIDMDLDFNSNFDDGNFLYIVNEDGKIVIGNILLDQNINSFTRFETNYGNIKNVCVLDDDVYLMVERNNNIQLEKIANIKTDFTKTINLQNSNIITGLDDYDGMNIRVYDANKDYGVYTVNNNTIELNEIVNGNINIGIDIECELKSNPISVNQQTRSIKSRIAKVIITTNNTEEMIFNGVRNKSSNNIFEILGVSGWYQENKFDIKSTFNNLEIKSIVLFINYGR